MRLFQCKGKKYPRVFPVPIEANSVNEGDVFILHVPSAEGRDKVFDKIYQWVGNDCTPLEKVKGLEVAASMKNEDLHTKANLYFPKDDATHDEEFWGFLGGKPA